MPRRPRRFALVSTAAAAFLLTAVPAGAHPYFEGGEAPTDSLASLTLAMAHGCGADAGGEGSPTTEVALEVPDWMRLVDVPAEDGWEVEQETDDDGDVAVVSWRTDDPVEAAPAFRLDAVVSGEAGEERFVRVFQGCEEGEHRWIGTPDEPADEPAVRLTLAEPDPGRPAPPPAESGGGAGPDGAASDEAGQPDAGAQPPEPAEPGAGEPATTDLSAAPEAATPEEPEGSAGADTEDASEAAAAGAEEPAGGAGWLMWVLAAVAGLVVVGGAALLATKRSRNPEAGG